MSSRPSSLPVFSFCISTATKPASVKESASWIPGLRSILLSEQVGDFKRCDWGFGGHVRISDRKVLHALTATSDTRVGPGLDLDFGLRYKRPCSCCWSLAGLLRAEVYGAGILWFHEVHGDSLYAYKLILSRLTGLCLHSCMQRQIHTENSFKILLHDKGAGSVRNSPTIIQRGCWPAIRSAFSVWRELFFINVFVGLDNQRWL